MSLGNWETSCLMIYLIWSEVSVPHFYQCKINLRSFGIFQNCTSLMILVTFNEDKCGKYRQQVWLRDQVKWEWTIVYRVQQGYRCGGPWGIPLRGVQWRRMERAVERGGRRQWVEVPFGPKFSVVNWTRLGVRVSRILFFKHGWRYMYWCVEVVLGLRRVKLQVLSFMVVWKQCPFSSKRTWTSWAFLGLWYVCAPLPWCCRGDRQSQGETTSKLTAALSRCKCSWFSLSVR